MTELDRVVSKSYVLIAPARDVTDFRGKVWYNLYEREIYVLGGEAVTESRLCAVRTLRDLARESGEMVYLSEIAFMVDHLPRIVVPFSMENLAHTP